MREIAPVIFEINIFRICIRNYWELDNYFGRGFWGEEVVSTLEGLGRRVGVNETPV